MFDHAKKTITRVSERARVLFCLLAMHSFLSVLATIPTTTEVKTEIVSYLVCKIQIIYKRAKWRDCIPY